MIDRRPTSILEVPWGMPKASVYLPDELYRRAREHDLPLSALMQQAFERALPRASLEEWIAR